jgi:GNAT superfamily N-acetyltransferase
MGKPEGYVGELFVKTAWRGKGFGSELLRRAINEARERGCCRIRLINIRDRESYRRGFYAKQGWQERTDAADFMMKLD